MDDAARQRVARIARWNGGSIAAVAGLGALLAFAGGNLVAGAFAATIAIAGWRELGGGRRLAAGGPPGAARDALVSAELTVLVALVGYSAWRLLTADVAAELAALPAAERELLASLTGGDQALLEQLLGLALRITYGTLIAVALVYQGGLAWWYSDRLGSTA